MSAQLPDRIIYNLEFFNLCTNPLESYWAGKRRPKFCGRDKCKRGYIATWELRDNKLFLTEIDGEVKKSFRLWGPPRAKYSLQKLFGRRRVRVHADWFSGKLRIPGGRMTEFVDNEYDSRFEKDMIITIDRGDVKRVVTMDNRNKTVVVNEGVIGRSVNR